MRRIDLDLMPNGPKYERRRRLYEEEIQPIEFVDRAADVRGGALVCWESNEGRRTLCSLRQSSDLVEWRKLRFIDAPTGGKARLFVKIGEYSREVQNNGGDIDAVEMLMKETGRASGIALRLMFEYGANQYVLMDISDFQPEFFCLSPDDCEIERVWNQFEEKTLVKEWREKLPDVMSRRADGRLVLGERAAITQMKDLIRRTIHIPGGMNGEMECDCQSEKQDVLKKLRAAGQNVNLTIGPVSAAEKEAGKEYGSYRFLKGLVSYFYGKQTLCSRYRARALGLGMLRRLFADESYHTQTLNWDWTREVSEDAIEAAAALFCALTQKYPSPCKK